MGCVRLTQGSCEESCKRPVSMRILFQALRCFLLSHLFLDLASDSFLKVKQSFVAISTMRATCPPPLI